MLAVDRLVFDMYDQRPGDYATHVEEAEASFVLYVGMLYVGMRRLFDDPWVEEGHRSAIWSLDNRGCSADPDLWSTSEHDCHP